MRKRIHNFPMPLRIFAGVAASVVLPLGAAELVYEPFDHAAGATLTGLAGGSGWSTLWTHDGVSGTIHSEGLTYTDSIGNVLDVSGLAMNTAGSETTRNFRTVSDGPLNDVWISFLYHLPSSNSNFEGVTFYRGASEVISVSNPSTTTGAGIRLESRVPGGTGSQLTPKGAFGTTHFIVLKLGVGAAPDGRDQAEIFIDPYLSVTPSQPDAVVAGGNFDFDTIRIAAQNGSSLLVDELRIGNSYADVTPHDAAATIDSDGDGLTDAQEAILGLDPHHNDSALIAGIRENPHFFGLYDTHGILTSGGVVIQSDSDDPVDLIFEIQQSGNLVTWPEAESFIRTIGLPEGKNFLRVTLESN